MLHPTGRWGTPDKNITKIKGFTRERDRAIDLFSIVRFEVELNAASLHASPNFKRKEKKKKRENGQQLTVQ
jgi:hypothetical protein